MILRSKDKGRILKLTGHIINLIGLAHKYYLGEIIERKMTITIDCHYFFIFLIFLFTEMLLINISK